MRLILQQKLHRIVEYLELIVAVIITVIILFSIINMIIEIAQDPFSIKDSDAFYNFLNDALSIIVGVELVKMIIIPTSENVIETLLFAVSRHIIIDHGLPIMIGGILCVALLFFTKKYLFSDFQKQERFEFRSYVPLYVINGLLKSDLKGSSPNQTIGSYIENRLKSEDKVLEKGASVEVDDLLFTIARITPANKIKMIHVYRLEENPELSSEN